MRTTFESLRPAARDVAVGPLPRSPAGGGARRLTLGLGEVALVRARDGARLVAPTGRGDGVFDVPHRARIVVFAREMEIGLRLDDVRFAGGSAGSVALVVPLRALAAVPGDVHPLARVLSPVRRADGIGPALGEVVAARLVDELTAELGGLDYEPGRAVAALDERLRELHRRAGVLRALRDGAGLACAGPLRVTHVGCPAEDGRRHRAREEEGDLSRVRAQAERTLCALDAARRAQGLRTEMWLEDQAARSAAGRGKT